MFPIYRIEMAHRTDPMKTSSFIGGRMFRTQADAERIIPTRLEGYQQGLREKGHDPDNYELQWKFTHEESWCCTWFQHETFRDRFENPADVLADFHDYVDRMTCDQARFGDHPTPEIMKEFEAEVGRPWITLMGAEDRWRWRGADYDSSPPCECVDCEKVGLWRIAH